MAKFYSRVRPGTRPAKLDRRDYSFHRTFPHFAGLTPAVLPLMNYTFDLGLTMPDQVADGRLYGCTGYAQTEQKQIQDGIVYDPGYTYVKTCYMEGHDPDQGCDIRTSAKSLRVYGAVPMAEQKPGIDADAIAAKHKSGQSFFVDKAPGRDWFDSMRIALRSQIDKPVKNAISIGTPWFQEWENPPPSGLLTSQFVFDGNVDHYNWHDYLLEGEKTIMGDPTIRAKTWQGKNVGDAGWLYMDRATFNKAFDIYGTVALITAQAKPEDIRLIKIDTLQLCIVYLNRILAIINRQIQAHA